MKLENHLGFSKMTIEPAQPLAKREKRKKIMKNLPYQKIIYTEKDTNR